MIKLFKSNKLILLLLIIMCVILIINPLIYAKACLNGISVWAFKVLPLLFPFFVITKLIVNLSNAKPNFMDKFFSKVYHTPAGSFFTFVLSVMSGYPMGAKLICEMKNNDRINSADAKKMLSFCSVSGPMFMLGTVGLMMLNSVKAGLIILISNIIASLINGLIYRGKKDIIYKNDLNEELENKLKPTLLTDCVYDSLISILMVGTYIVLSFLIIQIFSSLHIFDYASNIICWVFKIKEQQNVVIATLQGLVEITGGINALSTTNVALGVKTIIASGLIGFGGFSIILQSLNFLSNLNIPIKLMLKQKLTQGLLCVVISIIFCLILF